MRRSLENGMGSRRGGIRATSCLFFSFFFFFAATSTKPFDLNERRVRVFGDTKGESGNRVSLHSSSRYRWIKLPLLPWPRPCVFLFLFPPFWKLSCRSVKARFTEFFEKWKENFGEGKFCCDEILCRQIWNIRIYGQVEHPYPCYIVSFNLDRDLKVYFFFF